MTITKRQSLQSFLLGASKELVLNTDEAVVERVVKDLMSRLPLFLEVEN